MRRFALACLLALVMPASAAADYRLLDDVAFSDEHLLIQEDNGSNRERGRIIAYQVHTGELGVVAQFDARLFSFPNPVLTINEESSGIIDAREVLGRGWWLFDAQVHRPADAARVTEGQLLAMRIKRWEDIYG